MHNWLVNKMCLFRCVRQMRVSSDSIDLCGAIRFASDAPRLNHSRTGSINRMDIGSQGIHLLRLHNQAIRH